MKNLKTIFILSVLMFSWLIGVNNSSAATLASTLKGKILLQVEQNGEAWYVNPTNELRYYLGRPNDAFNIMRELGLGISNKDFDSFNGYAPSRLSGRILLKVADSGKAYYVNTNDLKMYYLGRPADAFNVMRELGLGITDKNLGLISISGMANWKVYSNDKLGFEFKYPKEIVFQSKYTDFVSLADGVEADIPSTYNLPNSFQRSQKIYAGITSDESKEKCMPEIYSYLPTVSENNKTKAEHVNVGNIIFNKYTLPGDCAMDGCGIGYYYTNWQNDRCYKLSWFAIQANPEKSFANSNDPRAIAAKKAGESTTKKMAELTEQILSTFKFTKPGNNIFALSDINVGSKVGEMNVVSINPFNQIYNMGIPPTGLSDANASIEFNGEVTVTGNNYYISEGLVGDMYCFNNLDEASLKKLPMLGSDNRNPWFCFSNQAEAKQFLGKQSGKATVVIDRYTVNYYPSEVWNNAHLKKVVSKE